MASYILATLIRNTLVPEFTLANYMMVNDPLLTVKSLAWRSLTGLLRVQSTEHVLYAHVYVLYLEQGPMNRMPPTGQSATASHHWLSSGSDTQKLIRCSYLF